MDLQETFKEEWRQIIAKMIIDGTLQEIELPNTYIAKYVRFSLEGNKYFSANYMKIYDKYNRIITCVNLTVQIRCLFYNAISGYDERLTGMSETHAFFTNVRESYTANELQKLLLFTIHEFYCDLQETHLSNVEMVLQDCYMMKYIQKY